MATVDEQIRLAEQITKALPEVSRNDWNRWTQIAEKQGFDRAIRWAQWMADDITLRPAIKHSYRLIAQVVQNHRRTLKNLEREEQKMVFGYISWFLTATTLRGSWRMPE
jgi:hypothetical protein